MTTVVIKHFPTYTVDGGTTFAKLNPIARVCEVIVVYYDRYIECKFVKDETSETYTMNIDLRDLYDLMKREYERYENSNEMYRENKYKFSYSVEYIITMPIEVTICDKTFTSFTELFEYLK